MELLDPSGDAKRNSVLAALTPDQRRWIAGQAEWVRLGHGDILAEQDAVLEHVYLPLDSVISVIAGQQGQANLQVGLIGWEGMLGATLGLGVSHAPTLARVQEAGTALRMDTGTFQRVLAESPVLRGVVQRYLFVTIVQLAQTTLCTHFHMLEPRLARWLLMTHDRAASNTFGVTHAFLAYTLGVRRAGVTKAASALQRRKLVGYQRGSLTVLDRAGLEAASCDCYRSDRETYDHLMR